MDHFTRIAAVVVLGVGAAAARFESLAPPSPTAVAEVGAIVLPGAGRDEVLDDRFLDLLGAQSVSFRSYGTDPAETVWVFLAWFDNPREGSQVHSPRNCYPGSGWAVLSDAKVPAPWGSGFTRRLVVSDGRQERLVDYWFQRPDGVLTSVFELKRKMVFDALRRRRGSMLFARVSTAVAADHDRAEQRLEGASRIVYERASVQLQAKQ